MTTQIAAKLEEERTLLRQTVDQADADMARIEPRITLIRDRARELGDRQSVLQDAAQAGHGPSRLALEAVTAERESAESNRRLLQGHVDAATERKAAAQARLAVIGASANHERDRITRAEKVIAEMTREATG